MLQANIASSDGGGLYNRAGGGFLSFPGTAELTNTTVRDNGTAGNGAGIWNGGTLTVVDGTIGPFNLPVTGGGIFQAGGSLTLSGTTVSDNLGTTTAGIHLEGGTADLTAVTVASNAATGAVGGIFVGAAASMTLTGSTVTGNSTGTSPGGILVNGTATIRDSIISSNSGRGIGNTGGTLDLTDTTISGNTAISLAGGILNAGTLTMTGGSISNNTAGTTGGGLWNGAPNTATLTNTTISGNTATTGGGGGIRNAGMLTLSGGSVSGNSSGDAGGGLLNDGGTVTITGVTFSTNTATGDGGGVANASGTVQINDSQVTGNTAGSGGGLSLDGGGLTMTNSTVSGNSSLGGGGLFVTNAATATLTASIVSGNAASFGGGGIQSDSGNTLTLEDSVVRGNETGIAGGGGIWNRQGTLTLIRSEVSGNTQTGGASGGGGILHLISGSVTLTNSTISGNASTADGGGIHMVADAGTVTLLNSTVTGNIAAAGQGGGIDQTDGSTTLRNSIVALNSPADCQGAVVSFGNNLDRDGSCNLVVLSDLAGVDPLLGPLASNGGPTQTHALLAGSPAINAGNDGVAPATDQRGLARVGTSDIGAFEFQSADADGDGFDDVAAGGTDCDDGDASIFPGAVEVAGDGIDQGCDGQDLAAEADPALVTVSLVGGFNAVVFTGADGTPAEDVAAAVGPALDSILHFDAASQGWLVFRSDAPIPALNTLSVINQRDALFRRLFPGATAAFAWPDLLPGGAADAILQTGFTFVGYTGADGIAVNTLIANTPGITALFLFSEESQQWRANRPGQPAFLSNFFAVGRLRGLFVFNPTASPLTIQWIEVAAGPG